MCAIIIRSPVIIRRPMFSFSCSLGIDSQRCSLALRSAAMGLSRPDPSRDHRDLCPGGQSQKKSGGPVDRPGPPRVGCGASYCASAALPDLPTVVLPITKQFRGSDGACGEHSSGVLVFLVTGFSAMVGCAL